MWLVCVGLCVFDFLNPYLRYIHFLFAHRINASSWGSITIGKIQNGSVILSIVFCLEFLLARLGMEFTLTFEDGAEPLGNK